MKIKDFTIQDITKIAEEKGFKVISKNYNAKIKTSYECEKGHVSEYTLSNFRKLKKCLYCRYLENTKNLDENELWLPVVNHEKFYEVSNYGRIKSIYNKNRIRSGRILSTKSNDKLIYEKVSLTNSNGEKERYYKVHQVVARTFIPLPDANNVYEVNHIDGNRHNNRVDNLEWVTRLENIHHKKILGTELFGSEHQNSIHTEEMIREVKMLIKNGLGNTEIEKITGVKSNTVYSIKKGNTWKHIRV